MWAPDQGSRCGLQSALQSFVSCREVIRFCVAKTGAHSALCAFVLPPSFGSGFVRQLKRSGSVLCSKDGGALSTMRYRTAPVLRFCYRASAEERWFGSVKQRRGRTQHYALSYCPRQKAVKPYLSAGA